MIYRFEYQEMKLEKLKILLELMQRGMLWLEEKICFFLCQALMLFWFVSFNFVLIFHFILFYFHWNQKQNVLNCSFFRLLLSFSSHLFIFFRFHFFYSFFSLLFVPGLISSLLLQFHYLFIDWYPVSSVWCVALIVEEQRHVVTWMFYSHHPRWRTTGHNSLRVMSFFLQICICYTTSYV